MDGRSTLVIDTVGQKGGGQVKKFLKIVGLGLILWSLGMVWPFVNIVLTPRVTDALVVGLVVALSAYFLGQHFTQPFTERQKSDEADLAPVSQLTRPAVPVVYPFKRTSRPTRPIPELVGPNFHSRTTRPVPVIQGRMHHSRITRPMPMAR
jgi:hypothetical protein